MESKEEPNKIQATYDYKGKHEISEIPEDFKSFKEKIKELYKLDDNQLDKIQISYKDKEGNKTYFINGQKDYEKAKLFSEQIIFTIEDVVEEKDIINENDSMNDMNYCIINEDRCVYLNPERIKMDKKKEKSKPEINIDDNYFINMLTKPDMKVDNLDYIENSYGIYVNLFEIKLKKDIVLYQYPYKLVPEVESGDVRLLKKIFKFCLRELKSIYGECFIMGDSLYGFNKVEELKTVKTAIRGKKGRVEFKFEFEKYKDSRIIKQADIQNNDQVVKTYIELLIKDILSANTNLDYYKRLFIKLDERKEIYSERNQKSVNFYPGYMTSFVETNAGKFLNVSLRNKIIQQQTILDYLKEKDYKNQKNREKIKDSLIDEVFKPFYDKKSYAIDDICFDRNPKNQTFNLEGVGSITLYDYYKKYKKIVIEDIDQPLIVVKKNDKEQNPTNLYFIPSLCHFTGINDELSKDYNFMKKLADYTKLNPEDRVRRTNQFLNLLTDTGKRQGELSPKEKSEEYGIEVRPVNKPFQAYQMKGTQLLAENNKILKPKDKVFHLLKTIKMDKWLCLYQRRNYDDAAFLSDTLINCSEGYGLEIKEPEWIEMNDRANYQDWINEVENSMKSKNNYKFVVFLLDKNDYIYSKLKKHSLCTNGYVSQVIKTKSLKKNAMSVCSKILLQINAKLRGVNYKIKFDKTIENRELMVMGVDSSHIKGKRTGVAMVASIDKDFTDFYNKEEIIKEENKEQLQFKVSSFIEEAINTYKKENKGNKPKNLIIYRQGVSLQQKKYLKGEIINIDKVCKTNNILYYYILVNTKVNYKFFAQNQKVYSNPGPGLLVVDGITNRNFFEFYIQPQLVTGGSATPTCFHVAYGNMNFPEFLPKFTYDLCHLYSNWQGPVRIPNVIKAAEKLAKMTAKYTFAELNDNLKLGQSYL